MTESERRQAIQFQDAIGEVVDVYLCEGMPANRIAAILRDEASSDLDGRRNELETKR